MLFCTTGKPGQEFNPGRDALHSGRNRDKMQIPARTGTGTGTFHLFNHFFRMYAIRMKTYSEYAMCVR